MNDDAPARSARGLLSWLLYILRTIVYGWAVSFAQLVKLFRRRRPRRKGSDRDRRAAPGNRVPIDDPAFVGPEPLLYSQRHLMDLGLAGFAVGICRSPSSRCR